jgi:hypothetical protein
VKHWNSSANLWIAGVTLFPTEGGESGLLVRGRSTFGPY